MSAYTTKIVDRKEAEELLRQIYAKNLSFEKYTKEELEDELDAYSYTDRYTDILGVLFDFKIK